MFKGETPRDQLSFGCGSFGGLADGGLLSLVLGGGGEDTLTLKVSNL